MLGRAVSVALGCRMLILARRRNAVAGVKDFIFEFFENRVPGVSFVMYCNE